MLLSYAMPQWRERRLLKLTLLDKARFIILGYSDLIIAVDHKPLLKVFSDPFLEEVSNTRL